MEMIAHPYDELLRLPTELIRLDCAALHLARDFDPDVNITANLSMLDELAERVAARRPGLSAIRRYVALRDVLVEECGFSGNEDDYYDPANSYLPLVLRRRVGVPISLAVVWLETARRLKWNVSGLNFPGHYLVRIDDAERFVIVDPFRRGKALRKGDCQKILDHCFDGRVRFERKMLAPTDTRGTLARMLRNLKAIYEANQDWPRLEAVLQRLRATAPADPRPVVELAALWARQGRVRNAWGELHHYLASNPPESRARHVRKRIGRLQAELARLN
ncbi:MAG: hypothetical protein D6744_19125 [Planctomycetota bacterium]|nr:MAG: hypothetical protein D6744_19125 [Planctomycetota bacterium]